MTTSDQKDDYYRREASDAQERADRAIRDDDRAGWLRIAQSWLALIKGRARSAEEMFDDTSKARGTRQDVSTESQ